MSRIRFWLTVAFFLLSWSLLAHPARATSSCRGGYFFSSGAGNNLLNYCVTVNGNFPGIQTHASNFFSIDGEGYGICNESPAQNYTDYAFSDTGNWKPSVLLSHTSTSVEIARTTSDGHWTLTQTITMTHVPSITVVMALKNNQSVQKVAYLVRSMQPATSDDFFASPNGAFGWYYDGSIGFGLGKQLENVGTPQFGFWRGYVLTTNTGPNACAFAFNAASNDKFAGAGSMVVAYVGPVPAGATRSVTLTYRGL